MSWGTRLRKQQSSDENALGQDVQTTVAAYEKQRELGRLDGKISIPQAFPYGVQHVLAMFVSNLAPIAILCAAADFDSATTAMLIQNAMVIAAIGTFIQLYPVWRVGSGLPIVMGISFTFVTVLCGIAATYGYGAVVGAVIVGGCLEGVLGLFAKYWRRFITPVVSAVVVTSIGFSLLSVGAESFGGGSGAADFGSMENLFLGAVSLIACLIFQGVLKGPKGQLSVLFGLCVGYVVAVFMGKVDFSAFENLALFQLPTIMPFVPEFRIDAIIAVTLLFLVSAAETIGDTCAISEIAVKREASEKEVAGAVAADGFVSALSGVFGCSPLTSFAQNIGLLAMTNVVNRKAVACGGAVMLVAGCMPIIGTLFSSLPDSVLGGCTIMMFGSIILTGFQMISKAGFTQRNITIAALSLAIGIGFTQVSDIFAAFPELAQSIFVGNSVALVFVVAVVLELVLPKKEPRNILAAEKDAAPDVEAEADTEADIEVGAEAKATSNTESEAQAETKPTTSAHSDANAETEQPPASE